MKSSELMLSTCFCNRVRSLSRLITRSYDDCLRSTGLKASQLSVLAAIDSLEEPSIAALSKKLQMDRTTLSRNLKPLIAERLAQLSDEGWRRSKTVTITKAGRARLKVAVPLWQSAQANLIERIGESRWRIADAHLGKVIARY